MARTLSLDSAISSPMHQRAKSTSTYHSESRFSASTSTLGSFVHVSTQAWIPLATLHLLSRVAHRRTNHNPSDSQWYKAGLRLFIIPPSTRKMTIHDGPIFHPFRSLDGCVLATAQKTCGNTRLSGQITIHRRLPKYSKTAFRDS